MQTENIAHPDPRQRKIDFDLNKVDYNWIEKTNDKKELKNAYRALEADGFFPDLLRVCGEKLVSLDPNFKRVVEGEKKLTMDEEQELENDLLTFLDAVNKTDSQLRGKVNGDNKENSSLFSNPQQSQIDGNFSGELEKMQKKKRAEDERLKGNEFIKSKDYQDAVTAYTKSIELDSTESFTFANRAMAYLKLKEYKKVIEDANKALELKPGYLKAVHRRGKAYLALERFEEAIKDFQLILEQEPNSKEVNRDLMDARHQLNLKESKKSKEAGKSDDNKSATKNSFKRIAIEESDEEDDEPKVEQVTTGAPHQPSKSVFSTLIDARDAKKAMKRGGDEFMIVYDNREKRKQEELEERKKREEAQRIKEEEQKKAKAKAEAERLEQEEARLRAKKEEEEKQKKLEQAKQEAERQKKIDEAERLNKQIESS